MKKLLAILLVVATIFCFAACDGDTNTTTTTANSDTTTTTTAQNDETTTTTAQNDETTTEPVEDETTTEPVEDETTTTTIPDKVVTGINGVDINDSNNWKKVVNGVFTSDKGGLQMKAAGWKTYALYNISFVPQDYVTGVGQTNAVCVMVYDADPADVFAAKTKADFESVLLVGLDEFSATTVCGYPAYKAVATDAYYVWVVNTPTHKYFINFMQAPLDNGGWDFSADIAAFMSSLVIYK